MSVASLPVPATVVCLLQAPPDGVRWRRPAAADAFSKRATDLMVAGVLLVLLAPLLVLVGVLVKLTSRGPVIYTQTRAGRRGQPFSIHKFRTMVHDCERQSGVRWATPDDPRITRLGRFLRRTHLDELPQLWDVVRGAMSLVGPRPERPEFIPNLEQAIPGYGGRLEGRPGMTGLAQLQLPPDTDLASVSRKLRYDLHYLREASLSLDLRILLCTALYLGGVPYRTAGRWLRLPQGLGALRPAANALTGGCPAPAAPDLPPGP
jgi:lipopolysaccharide/colanic/teichoic acid biosynthesis glycosyltransferase